MSSGANNSSSKRFELPKLDFAFSSLTEGTDIPPPPESPVQKVPTPPKTPPAQEKKEEAAKSTSNGAASGVPANGSPAPAPAAKATAGTKRPADEAPLSPAPSSTRAGSIRRLFSRNLLNNSYAEGELQSQAPSTAHSATPASAAARPISRSNGSILDEKKAKRGSGFFRRLRSSDSAAKRVPYENVTHTQSKPEVRGPPPPMIPELSALESKLDINDGGSLGSDLFKNIK